MRYGRILYLTAAPSLSVFSYIPATRYIKFYCRLKNTPIKTRYSHAYWFFML